MLSVTVSVRKDWNLTRRGGITRSRVCCASQEMENAWNEYSRLERDVDWLKSALQGQMSRGDLSQVCGYGRVWELRIGCRLHTPEAKNFISY